MKSGVSSIDLLGLRDVLGLPIGFTSRWFGSFRAELWATAAERNHRDTGSRKWDTLALRNSHAA